MFTKKEEQEKERDREEESLAQKASCLHVHKEALLPRGYLPLGRLFVTLLRVSCAMLKRQLHCIAWVKCKCSVKQNCCTAGREDSPYRVATKQEVTPAQPQGEI